MLELGRRLIVAASLLPLAASATAQEPSARETVRLVADRIESHYYDPVKAKAIAEALEKEAATGTFDRYSDPADLATALTTRLKPLDGHFAVQWVASSAPAAGPPRPEADPEMNARRSGYGFRRVEILPGNIGYIDLRRFEPIDFSKPDGPVRQAADAALTMVSKASAIIIDLRDNGGGSPHMVGYLTSAFVGPDRDVYNVFHGRRGEQSERPEQAYAKPMLDKPVYLLTSARTGSAAEALAYTLQAADRGIVVGEASAGAANPGGTVPTGNGFTVFVSNGSPRNVITGGNWEGTGVQPDIIVPAAKALDHSRLIALETVMPTLPPEERQDTQWAMDSLLAARRTLAAGEIQSLAGTYGIVTLSVQDGALFAKQGRRPAQRLLPLSQDLFYVADEPSRRIQFERGADGKVAALEQIWSDGSSVRRTRN